MTEGTGDGAPSASAETNGGKGQTTGRATGRWARYWNAVQEHNPIWAFLLRVMSIEPRDCPGAERTFPMLLLGLAVANGCVALFTVPAAIGVIAEQSPPGARKAGGLVAGAFIFLIDLMVVSQHPHPPRWLPAIRLPVLPEGRRLGSHRNLWQGPAQSWTGYWVTPMPAFPQRLLTMIPRIILTVGIAVVVGGGMNLAINKDAIAQEKNLIRLHEIQEQNETADAGYQEDLKNLEKNATDAATRLSKADAAYNTANTLLRCEQGHRENTNCGNIQSGNGEGTRIATDRRRAAAAAREQAATASTEAVAALERLRRLGPPSKRPGNTLRTPNTSGWQRTKAAFDRYAADAQLGWFAKYLPELVLGGIDLIPLLFKLLAGYPAHDLRRWLRQHEDVFRLRRPLAAGLTDEHLAATEAAVDLEALRSAEVRQIAVDTAARLTKIKGERRMRRAERETADEQWQAAQQSRAARPYGGSARDTVKSASQPHAEDADAESETEHEVEQLGLPERKVVESVPPTEGSMYTESEPTLPDLWNDLSEDDTQVLPEYRHTLAPAPRSPDVDVAPWDNRLSQVTPELDAPWDADLDFEDRPWFESNGRWVIGPQIAPDPFHRKGSHLYLAIRRNNNASQPERFRASDDCAVVKVVKDLRLQRDELNRQGQVISSSLLRSWSPVMDIHQLVEDGHTYKTGLLYSYHPRTDAERYLGSQAEANDGAGHLVKYRDLVRWMLPPARALEIIWLAGYAHNDVKPRNMLLTGPHEQPPGFVRQANQTGDMLLCDLDSLGIQGRSANTPGSVRAPECWDVDLPVGSTAADTYGLGSSMFFFLTGKTPNQVVDASDDRGSGDWFRFHLGTEFRDFLPDGVPDALADAVLQFIATRPEERLTRPPAVALEDSLRSVPEDSTYLFQSPAYESGWAPSGWSDVTRQLIRESGYLDPDTEGE